MGESGRSKAPKVDGTGLKWTVRKDIKGTVQNTKVDSPQKSRGGQKGMKVDGILVLFLAFLYFLGVIF